MVKQFLKALPVTLIIVVILLAIIILVGLTGVNTWPFLFILFYFSTFCGMKWEKVVPVAVWGFLGFFGGYLTPLFGDIGGILLLVYLVVLLNISVSGVAKSFDPACFLMLTLTTGIPATLGLCTAASFPKDLAGFGAGVVLMVVMGLISKSGEKKATAKAAAAEKAE